MRFMRKPYEVLLGQVQSHALESRQSQAEITGWEEKELKAVLRTSKHLGVLMMRSTCKLPD